MGRSSVTPYGYLPSEYVTASGHAFHHEPIDVTEGTANVADALRDCVIRNSDIVPDRSIYGLSVQQAACVCDEQAQEIERLGPEGDHGPVRVKQCSSHEIKGMPLEMVDQL